MTSATADLGAVLDAIVRRHGPTILDDRARLFGLLRDHAPHALRDVRVLMAAFDAGVIERLRQASDLTAAASLATEAARVADASGCRPDLSDAAVRIWAGLLGRLAGGPPAVQPLPAYGAVLPLPLPAAPPAPASRGLLARILGRS